MKIVLLFIYLIIFSFSLAGQEGIRFETLTLEEVIEKAQSENKLIFVDCYTKTCGPCAWMDEHIFPLKETGNFFNSKFVSIKIDLGTEEGKSLKKRYPGIQAVPTFLILRPNGVLQHRFTGSSPLDHFLERVKRGMTRETAFYYLQERYSLGGMKTKELLNYWIASREGRYEDETKHAEEELKKKMTEKEWTDTYFWPFIEVKKYGSPEFDKVLNCIHDYQISIGKERVDKYLSHQFLQALEPFFNNQDNDIHRLEEIRRQASSVDFEDQPRVLTKIKLISALQAKDKKTLFREMKTYLPFVEDREFQEMSKVIVSLAGENSPASANELSELAQGVLDRIKNEEIKNRLTSRFRRSSILAQKAINPSVALLYQRQNWHLKCFEKDSVYGIDWYGAMALLANFEPKKEIVVAVIDSGVDEEHEALISRLWVNPGEIIGNGVDDDKNGYVDDIHGWNFLGTKNGKILETAREADRIYLMLKEKKEKGVKLSIDETKKYNKSSLVSRLAKKEKNYEQAAHRVKILCRADSLMKRRVKEEFGTDFYNLKGSSLFNWKSLYFYTLIDKNHLTETDLEFIEDIQLLLKGGVNWEVVMNSFKQGKEALKKDVLESRNHARIFERGEMGDDIYNLKDHGYGTNRLKNDFDFHGTHVAGTIAAESKGEQPAIGIAPHAKIMGIKAVANGDEYDKDVALAIRYAVDNGARVINMSFSKPFSEHPEWVEDALDYAAKHNVLVCHSAGNNGICYDEQMNYPRPLTKKGLRKKNMITVGNSDLKGLPAKSSNWGRKCVDLFAPGSAIYSTYSNNQYKSLSGTSMATPVVSGVAALILTYFPEITAEELKQILQESAVTPFAKKDSYLFVGGRSVYEPKELCHSGGILNARVAIKKAIQLSKKKSR